MAYEAAREIGRFMSWADVGSKIVQVAQELDSNCPNKSIESRRDFVLGGLHAFREAFGWDMMTQSDETEEQVLWMFVQLFIR